MILVIYNKKDKNNNYKYGKLSNYSYINISTFDKECVEELRKKISEIFDLKSICESNYTYISNARQIGLLNNSMQIIFEIETALEMNYEIDMIEIDLKRLWNTLSSITGEVNDDDLLNEIFSKFCLGK